jgi:hypothetical protein
MLTEIIIYIALFAILFSSVFVAAFQIIDAVEYLQVQKNTVDNLYFLRFQLDSLVQSNPNWDILSDDLIKQSISSSSPGLSIESVSSKIFETATSPSRVLFLTLGINKKSYVFSYVQEK